MKELLEVVREYFATSAWGSVIQTAVALAIIARLIRIIFTALPWLQTLLSQAVGVLAEAAVVGARWCRLALRDALTYKHATEPRWVQPVWRGLELFSGAYFALVFYLFFLQFTGFVLYPPAGLALWKRAAAAVAAAVVLVMGKVFTVQARDAWVQLRTMWRGRSTRTLLLPARTGDPVSE